MKDIRNGYWYVGILLMLMLSARLYAAKEVTIEADNISAVYLTQAETVADFLKEAGFLLGKLDRTIPSPATRIEDGLHIRIIRVRREISWREREIPIKEYRLTSHLKEGEQKVLQAGSPKIVLEKWVSYFKGNIKTLAKRVSVKVLQKGKPRIVLVGKRSERVFRGRKIKKVLTMIATAYHPRYCLGCNGKGLTATGKRAKYGVVAVDPRVIPLYSRLYIPNYGYAVALDTGGAIKGNRIDLVFESLKKVRRFGKKKIKVYLLY